MKNNFELNLVQQGEKITAEINTLTDHEAAGQDGYIIGSACNKDALEAVFDLETRLEMILKDGDYLSLTKSEIKEMQALVKDFIFNHS